MRFAKAILLASLGIALCPAAQAQQTQSRLFEITKSHKLRVCTFTGYYAISFRNPQTQKLEGIDIDLAGSLAKSLGAELQFGTEAFRQRTCKIDVDAFQLLGLRIAE